MRIKLLTVTPILWALLNPAPSFGSVGETIKAGDAAPSEQERAKAFSALRTQNASTPEDVKAIYGSFKRLEKNYKKGPDEEAFKAELNILRFTLARSTAAATGPTVAELLNTESHSFPTNYFGPLTSLTSEARDREGIRFALVGSLIEAAGAGKNELALPILRKMAKTGGMLGELANRAIGRIGRFEDLDAMISKIKSDPKARIDLTPFGSIVVDRVMAEINNPSLPEDARTRLIGHLDHGHSPENIDKYRALLHNPDPRIVRVASRVVSESVRNGREEVALGMLTDRDRQVRVSGLIAFQQLDWKESYRSSIEDLMAHDDDEGVREIAAHILGVKKVAKSQDALKLALNDRSRRVRDSAQGALDEISGKRQAEIDREVQEVLKRRNKGAPN